MLLLATILAIAIPAQSPDAMSPSEQQAWFKRQAAKTISALALIDYDCADLKTRACRILTHEDQVAREAAHSLPAPGSSEAVARFLEAALYGDNHDPDQATLAKTAHALFFRDVNGDAALEASEALRDIVLELDSLSFYISAIDGAVVMSNCLQVPWRVGFGRFYRERETWKEMWGEDKRHGNQLEFADKKLVWPALQVNEQARFADLELPSVDRYLAHRALVEGERALLMCYAFEALGGMLRPGEPEMFDPQWHRPFDRANEILLGFAGANGVGRRRFGSGYLYRQWCRGGWDAVRAAVDSGGVSPFELLYPSECAALDLVPEADRRPRVLGEGTLRGLADDYSVVYSGPLGPIFWNEVLSHSVQSTKRVDVEMLGPGPLPMALIVDEATLHVHADGRYILDVAMEFRSALAAKRFALSFSGSKRVARTRSGTAVRLVASGLGSPEAKSVLDLLRMPLAPK